MIHFFPIFSRNAADTEFGHALRRIGVQHRIFAGDVRFNYKSRLKWLLVCIPRLVLFAAGAGVASLVRSQPAPDVVVLGSDIEVAIFALIRALTRRRTRIMLGSFIYTSRATSWQNRLRHSYYARILRQVDVAIVHSRLEVARYTALFPNTPTRFRFVPWGTTIDARARLLGDAPFAPGQPGVIVTAGRSGRDYATLFKAVAGTGAELRVICDYLTVRPDIAPAAHITVLSSCHGEAYVRELIDAALVVVPLAAGDISAGQMVVIQAMGLGKAVIVTDTPTIRDYVTDREDAWLVPMGDSEALRHAMANLLANPAERERLGRNAMACFNARLSTEGHLRGLIAASDPA